MKPKDILGLRIIRRQKINEYAVILTADELFCDNDIRSLEGDK